jgi:hypothetical protein
MPLGNPIDPKIITPDIGCESLDNYCTAGSSSKLVSLYHDVLTGCGCCGFAVFSTEEACEKTKEAYGVDNRYSMVLDLDSY